MGGVCCYVCIAIGEIACLSLKFEMTSNEVSLPPLRPMEDYLLGSARFGLPDYGNIEKWNKRIVNNLLYYQTNYLLTAMIVFCLAGYIRPYEMVAGAIVCIGTFAGMVYAASNRDTFGRFKKEHPGIVIAGLVCACTFVMYALGSILVFAFGIALPVLCIMVHASLRMRNLKNKVLNTAEAVGLKSTPMGKILKALDQEM